MNGRDKNSFHDLTDLRHQLQQTFGQDFFKSLAPAFQSGKMQADFEQGGPFPNLLKWLEGVFPRVDLYQTRNELIAVLELPGIENSQDVKLSVESRRLVVRGEQKNRYTMLDEEQFLLTERHRGAFEREILLPIKVIPNKVRAVYRLGLLEVHMIKDTEVEFESADNTVPIEFE